MFNKIPFGEEVDACFYIILENEFRSFEGPRSTYVQGLVPLPGCCWIRPCIVIEKPHNRV